jgi:hypothetical protein
MHFSNGFFRVGPLALLILCALIGLSEQQQGPGTWTWLGGSRNNAAVGVYGTKGVPSPANWPGARSRFTSWYLPIKQEYWIFGGEIADGGTFREIFVRKYRGTKKKRPYFSIVRPK